MAGGKLKPRIQATHRQRKAFKQLLLHGGSKHDALIAAGYSESIASNPAKVLETKSFSALMDSVGMTDEFLNESLHADIEAKPRNRLGELTLAYKLKGRLKESETGQSFTPATINIAIVDNTPKADNGLVKP